jgi:sugar lactone lactonase YvrE
MSSWVAVAGLGMLAQPARGQRSATVRFPDAEVFAAQPGQHGSTIVVDHEGTWVVERVAGVLVRTDLEGRPRASLSLQPGLGELIAAPRGVFVADRMGDRVLAVAQGEGGEPSITGEVAVREPYGLALSPDGATLLVTSVADHELVQLDAATLTPIRRVELRAEPRGVAISPDGTRAIVGFLSSGALAEIELASGTLRWHALDPRDEIGFEKLDFCGEEIEVALLEEPPSRFEVPNDTGRRFARSSFALAFAGDQPLVAHAISTPQMKRKPKLDARDSYGGGGADEGLGPLAFVVTRVSAGKLGSASLERMHLRGAQPRAIATFGAQLAVGGYGDDVIDLISLSTKDHSFAQGIVVVGSKCGIDGLAFAPDGSSLWVHCELSRSLVRIGLADAQVQREREWLRTPELAASPRGKQVEAGAELFRRSGDARLSEGGALACASCHPEGRSDGLSWRLGKSILQTPMLAGRVVDTAPYKWDGQDDSLRASVRHTIERLGGMPDEVRASERDAIVAYLQWLPAPRSPTVDDGEALARGREVFERECSSCHAGARLSDGAQHGLATSLELADTPSLIGLAHTAPYYHDGSAIDLATLIDDRATIHDMADTSKLDARAREDLVTYLESL